MAVTAGMIAKAAATVLSNEKLRKGVGWTLAAILSPVILLIAASFLKDGKSYLRELASPAESEK